MPTRHFHPDVANTELWPGPAGYPWAQTGVGLWTREALLRRIGPGRLLCTWTTGGMTEPWAGNHTMVTASSDDGTTWTTPEILFAHPTRGLFTTELFVPTAGEIHAFLQTYDNGCWMSQLQSYRAISRDGGQTWDGPHTIPGGVQNVWTNRGIVHSSGRWIIPVSWIELIGEEWAPPSMGRPPLTGRVGRRELRQEELPYGAGDSKLYHAGNAWCERNHRYACGVLISEDQGATFRLHGYLNGGKRGLLMEPRIVERADGSLAMLIRSQYDGWLWQSASTDAGATWTDPIRSEIPNPAAKVCLLRARDGRIFLLHNPTVHAGAIMGGRNPLCLWISDDDMRTWSVKVDLVRDDNPAVSLNYPDGFIDEERGELRFVWEDMYAVFAMRVPLGIGTP
jgi:hypothetical protein